jgi:hypothetical protein
MMFAVRAPESKPVSDALSPRPGFSTSHLFVIKSETIFCFINCILPLIDLLVFISFVFLASSAIHIDTASLMAPVTSLGIMGFST